MVLARSTVARRGLRLALLVGFVLVAAMSLTPELRVSSAEIWDKLQHAMAYGALAVLATQAYPRFRAMGVIAAVLAGFGISIELAQFVLPGRPSLGDVAADAAGIAIGLGLARGGGAILARRR